MSANRKSPDFSRIALAKKSPPRRVIKPGENDPPPVVLEYRFTEEDLFPALDAVLRGREASEKERAGHVAARRRKPKRDA